jgi:polysaccharide deacetylase family protein (PEP-CTERM system associated)
VTAGRETPSVLTVDVEEWFHLLEVGGPAEAEWDSLPSRVEGAFRRILDLLAARGTRVTCFFLGWVGERYPHLVREAAAAGHEIASHGYAHRLIYEMGPSEFREDASRARHVLEAAAGVPVLGFRAPGFSVTRRTPWFFDELAAAGYRYDSSVFPAARAHGGLPGAPLAPHAVPLRDGGSVMEFPVSVARWGPGRLCLFGGGYLRLFPYWMIRAAARRVEREGRPVVFYVHPREVDPGHPRLPLPPHRRWKSYVNLHTTEAKLRRLTAEFPLTTFRDLLAAGYAEDAARAR